MRRAVDVGGAAAARRAALLRHGRARRRPRRGAERARDRGDGAPHRAGAARRRHGLHDVAHHQAQGPRRPLHALAQRPRGRAFGHRRRHEARRTRRAAGQFRLRAGRVRGAARRRPRWPAGRSPACWCRSTPQPRLWRETLDQIHGVRKAGPRGQRAGRLAADRRHHGAGDHGPSLRRASGVARDAQALARRALRAARGRCRAAPPPARDASRTAARAPSWRESFHKMFPVGERPDYEPDAENSVAAIARAQRPHAAGGGARGDDGARTARAC